MLELNVNKCQYKYHSTFGAKIIKVANKYCRKMFKGDIQTKQWFLFNNNPYLQQLWQRDYSIAKGVSLTSRTLLRNTCSINFWCLYKGYINISYHNHSMPQCNNNHIFHQQSFASTPYIQWLFSELNNFRLTKFTYRWHTTPGAVVKAGDGSVAQQSVLVANAIVGGVGANVVATCISMGSVCYDPAKVCDYRSLARDFWKQTIQN